MNDWVCSSKESAELMSSRLAYQQAIARNKAHAILTYLGFNTATDWLEILTRMAEEGRNR